MITRTILFNNITVYQHTLYLNLKHANVPVLVEVKIERVKMELWSDLL